MRTALTAILLALSILTAQAQPVSATEVLGMVSLRALISQVAREQHVPDAVAQALVRRESRYGAHKVGRAGEIGLTQIKLPTARGMGYRGSRAELFDPRINLTYGFRYLHAAIAAGCICYFQRGIPPRKRRSA